MRRERGAGPTGRSWRTIERQLASLKQQLDIERRIVPDEKEVRTVSCA